MKLLIAGAGFIVSDFLPIAKEVEKLELVDITGTERDLKTMQSYQAEYGITELYTDYDQALAKTTADTVYVAVPNFLHYVFAKKALEAGKMLSVKNHLRSNIKSLKNYVNSLKLRD